MVWDPPDAFEDRFFKNFDHNSAKIPSSSRCMRCSWLAQTCHPSGPTPVLLQNSNLSFSPGLQASKLTSLQAFSPPRRVTRSANNPPAHPKDERRRARPLPIPYPFPIHILPKPFLTGLRVTLRGNRLRPLFFDFFFLSKFSSPNPTFFDFFSISGRPGVDFWPFFLPKQALGGYFFGVFSKTVILSKSCSHCGNNTILKGRTLQNSVRGVTPNSDGSKKQ